MNVSTFSGSNFLSKKYERLNEFELLEKFRDILVFKSIFRKIQK